MESFAFEVAALGGSRAIVYRAKEPLETTLVLAHGAGAGQSHPFMIDIAGRLAARGVDVVTFDFLYTHADKKMPDRNDVLEATWRAVLANVRARAGLRTSRLFIGGKSMGGRIASQVAAADRGLELRGLVFLGYPLHPIGKPKVNRDEHLPRIPFPMLFVQGTRDELGTAKELEALAKRKLPRARVHAVEGGDHSFALLKRDGGPEKQDAELDSAARAIVHFVRGRAR